MNDVCMNGVVEHDRSNGWVSGVNWKQLPYVLEELGYAIVATYFGRDTQAVGFYCRPHGIAGRTLEGLS